jgi:Major Facilitator Superfamily
MICPYIASYFRLSDPSVTSSNFLILNPISNISEALYTIIASYFFLLLKPIWVITIGITLSCTAMFFSSYITEPYLFCWVYGIFLGSLSATVFLPSVWILWNEIPENKGRTSGLMLSGFSFGPIPFGMLFTMLVNPYNYSPQIEHTDNNKTQKLFGSDVAENVPMTIRLTTLSYFVVGIIGVALLPKKWKGDRINSSKGQKTLGFYEMIKSWKFWNLFLMIFFGLSSFSFFINVYKIIAMIHINDDHFLAYTGSINLFFSCLGRVFFGVIFDKYSWKKVMSFNYALIILMTLIFDFSFISKYLFALCLMLINFLQTSIYSGILLQSRKDYPKDNWVFSYIYLAIIPCAAVPYIAENFITPYIGYFYTLVIISAMTFVVLIQTIFHKNSESENSELLNCLVKDKESKLIQD